MKTYTRDQVKFAANKQFPKDYVQEIMDILDLYGEDKEEQDRERVQLAILKLSNGDMGKLEHYCAMAKDDFRDVLYWAEYTADAKLMPDPYRTLLDGHQ